MSSHTLDSLPVPELVAPAGTPAKLEVALRFGADAVYLGLKRYSLRARAGNFDFDELRWALGYCHQRGRRVYVAVNLQPFDEDFAGLESTLRRLAELQPDGVIVADPGVLALARRLAPGLRLHLSTQASVTNAAAARFWAEQGVARIVVARELSLQRLGAVVQGGGAHIEAFVHGAVCVAYSGRCLLSLYWAGRDPRRGACAQGCRWAYREIEDGRRPGLGNPVEQDERGTYFFDARDLCALPLLEQLVATGVHALKIEGRTRSAYYLGCTVDVYRQALDLIARGSAAELERRRPALLAELRRVSRRGFSTHFYGGVHNDPASYRPDGSIPHGRNELVGQVTAAHAEGLEVKIVNPVRPGCRLELRDRGLSVEPVTLSELRTPDGALLGRALTGQRVVVPGRWRAEPGAFVRRQVGGEGSCAEVP